MSSSLKFQKITTIQTDDVIYSMCFLTDGRLASSSSSRISIYGRGTSQLGIIIYAGALSVCALRNGNLASSGKDVAIWEVNENDYTRIHTLKGHTKPIFKIIELEDGKICSCSLDTTIKIWENKKNYECIQTLTLHNDSVISIIEMNNYLISVGNKKDKKLIIWNKNTYQPIKTLQNLYCQGNTGLSKLKNNTIILGSTDELTTVDILTFKCQSYKSYKLCSIQSIYVSRENEVLIGNSDGEIVCFDSILNEVTCVKVFHRNTVSCIIKSEDNKIFSSSRDHIIRIFE